MMRALYTTIASCLIVVAAHAAQLPVAIATDPIADTHFPATSIVLRIPSGGVEMNGLAYVPSGGGPHPALVIFNGLPGSERNLDLAQAVRRAGWTVITLNYRGSWGSPGEFRLNGALEDADAVLKFLRDPQNAATLRIDSKRIALAGHSMGAWVAIKAAERDPAIIGTAIISMADMSMMRYYPHDQLVTYMEANLAGLSGATGLSLANEIESQGESFALQAMANNLNKRPLLALSVNDGLAKATTALQKAVNSQNAISKSLYVDTDHNWSGKRIELQTIVLAWLSRLNYGD
jgi:uncharacterized protein